ncbi:MAG: hypothetical protein DDT28_00497 [Dehalococcoidia bacterium]|nr:hypothetical protein [Chloroflexota bacterium]
MASGKLTRPALKKLFDAGEPGYLSHPIVDLRLRPFGQPQGKRDVLIDGHVRVEGIGLEDEANVAVLRLHLVHAHPVEEYLPLRGHVDTGDHEQDGSLTAA